jgi:Mrp family chromosome partitioning ATPase
MTVTPILLQQTSRNMNALDRAFIRAFAKESPSRVPSPEPETGRERIRDPEEWAESGSRQVLIMHELYHPGRSFRLDRPATPGETIPDSHLIYPTVERVESYDLSDVVRFPSPGVLVEVLVELLMEDHVAPLEPLCPRPMEAQHYLLWVTTEGITPELITRHVACPSGHDLPGATPWATGNDTGVWRADPILFDRLLARCAGDPAAMNGELAGSDEADAVVVPPRREPVTMAGGVLDAEPFRAAWEVDAFRWPEICCALDAATGGKLTQSGDELHVATHDGLKVLAVTAASGGEGTTTLALALARAAAQAGSRVALLDADTAQPDLARRLGLEPPCDWREAARRQSPTEAAIVSRQDAVTLFPLIDRDAPAGPRADAALLSDMLARLRPHFDLVIIDLPPLPLRPESDQYQRLDPGRGIDMAVLVRGVPTTSIDQTLRAAAQLRATGVRAVGIVENFTALSAAGDAAGEPAGDRDARHRSSGCDTHVVRAHSTPGFRTQAA